MLAGPSYGPLLAALGLLVAFIGVLVKSFLLIPLGLIFAVGCFAYWLYPSSGYIRRVVESGLDVRSGLPLQLTGARSTTWWGMLGLVTIGATAFGAFFYAYFYLQLFSENWPSPPPFQLPALAALMLATGGAAGWFGKRAFLAGNRARARTAMGAGVVAVLVYLGVESARLAQLDFGFREHAYGSIVWALAWATMVFAGGSAALLGCAWARLRPAESWETPALTLQLQLAAMFAVFTGAAGLAVFAVVQLSPLLFS